MDLTCNNTPVCRLVLRNKNTHSERVILQNAEPALRQTTKHIWNKGGNRKKERERQGVRQTGINRKTDGPLECDTTGLKDRTREVASSRFSSSLLRHFMDTDVIDPTLYCYYLLVTTCACSYFILNPLDPNRTRT